jgi:hypothetical protein
MGLIGGIARTAVAAGTWTAVSNRVSRRQANRWSQEDQSAYAAPPQAYQAPRNRRPPPRPQEATSPGDSPGSGNCTTPVSSPTRSSRRRRRSCSADANCCTERRRDRQDFFEFATIMFASCLISATPAPGWLSETPMRRSATALLIVNIALM